MFVYFVLDKARDQKQNYRMNEPKSYSGGGSKFVGVSHSPFLWLFGPLIGQIRSKFVVVCFLHLIPSHLGSKNPEILWNLMLQNQINDVDEIAYVSIGFDRHNALI